MTHLPDHVPTTRLRRDDLDAADDLIGLGYFPDELARPPAAPSAAPPSQPNDLRER